MKEKKWFPVAKHCPKTRDNALHAVCGKETIKLAAFAAATNRVFLNNASLLCTIFFLSYFIFLPYSKLTKKSFFIII